jgi:hypothetical protein
MRKASPRLKAVRKRWHTSDTWFNRWASRTNKRLADKNRNSVIQMSVMYYKPLHLEDFAKLFLPE